VKSSRAQIHARVYRLPELRFEDQRLTSHAGLVLLQALFRHLGLHEQLQRCFEHLSKGLIVGLPKVTMILIVHLMLGYRRLRDLDRYRDDPLIRRCLRLRRLPHVSTVSRALMRVDRTAVARVREVNRSLVLNRLQREALARVTLDFDGSVIASGRYAEGLAVGYNAKKKGQRSYYPLFATVAQTAQVLDVLHRSGNVHDSHGAITFMRDCIEAVRGRLPGVTVESRKDAAFFSDEIVGFLDRQGVEFTISVPFERFPQLKELIESRRRWKKLDGEWDYFETSWAPTCWTRRYRVLLLRHRVRTLNREPIQLELFIPHAQGYEFKAVITNKTGLAKRILLFHNGRGTQESLFSELKGQCQMDYVPTRRLAGNQLYFLSAVIAHNLYREMEMRRGGVHRFTTAKRAALWIFPEAATMRQRLILRAGRLTRPQGRLCLTMSGNEMMRRDFLDYLEPFKQAS
jgi:Transposase DDE domain group 1